LKIENFYHEKLSDKNIMDPDSSGEKFEGLLVQLVPGKITSIVLRASLSLTLAVFEKIAKISPLCLGHAMLSGHPLDFLDIGFSGHANTRLCR
jgi:hypothetical protein